VTVSRPYALSPLEVASGLVFGLVPSFEAADGEESPTDPIQALEQSILPALQRPPCFVSFSGGRDSSAVLAVAVNVARREGLPLPIPSTNRFPAATDSHESDWQERVVSHLGLDDWLRLELTDELDCVGPVATGVLRRHGLLWPFNAHFHVPQLEAASGGSLLTGIGGDETLSPSRWGRARAVLSGRARVEPRDILRVGFHAAPAALRRAVLRRRVPLTYSWFRPAAYRALAAEWAAEAASEPRGWEAQMAWRRRLRYLHVGLSSLALLAADASVRIVHPLVDAGFSAALAHLPKSLRFADRTAAMRLVFGELLPDEVLARTTKSSFDQAFWSEPSKAFVADWRDEGADPSFVDVEALRREWTSAEPDPRSFTQLQAAWLASKAGANGSAGKRVEQAFSGLLSPEI
jgi:diadenosine tetraphosphatase ApaH/serine/threonine PP2A family protein phosphatase